MISDDVENVYSFLVPVHDLGKSIRLEVVLRVSDLELLRIVALFISTIQLESFSKHARTHVFIRLFFELLESASRDLASQSV